MDKNQIVENTKEYVKNKLFGEGSGHDWFHIERVYNLSKTIAKEENADMFIVELTALLHDIDDWKFNDENKTTTDNIEIWLKSQGVDSKDIDKITNIIKTQSYKGGVVDSTQHTIEGKVVQDADRLDAIGAIGIARAFAYGGSKGRMMYDPNIKPMEFKSLDDVKNEDNHTVNHFYEKLLKLKDLMNTDYGKLIAKHRHEYMESFLSEFYGEWEGRL